MASFHGNFFVRSTDLLAMPAVPQDQSYAIEIQIEETITSPFVVFQTAVLHTTCYGQFSAPSYVSAYNIDILSRRTPYTRDHPRPPHHEQPLRNFRFS
jgi:hypothetical protein